MYVYIFLITGLSDKRINSNSLLFFNFLCIIVK